MEVYIRKATTKDAETIQKIINERASKGILLPTSLNDIYTNIRDYFLAISNSEKIVACVALHVHWDNLAEIRSLIVLPDYENLGVGSKLIKNALREAKELEINRVFTLTYIPDFFRKIGFRDYQKERLPQKIWKDCLDCIKFPNCDEEALIIDLK